MRGEVPRQRFESVSGSIEEAGPLNLIWLVVTGTFGLLMVNDGFHVGKTIIVILSHYKPILVGGDWNMNGL